MLQNDIVSTVCMGSINLIQINYLQVLNIALKQINHIVSYKITDEPEANTMEEIH